MSEQTPEPIEVVGVAKDRVGQPVNDGTAGSGLYSVPLQLSRSPSSTWARFFVQCWDRPPSFSTMHRPGIASVSGGMIVLDGTTIDEVEQYHLGTIKACIQQANDAEILYVEAERQKRERAEAERKDHQAHVDEVADRLKFD